MSDDIWKLRFLCLGVADRGWENLLCRTTLGSFASSVWSCRQRVGEFALSDDIWKLRFLCLGVADRGWENLLCRTTLGSFASSVWSCRQRVGEFALSDDIWKLRFLCLRVADRGDKVCWVASLHCFCVSSAFQSFALSLSRCSSNTLTKPLAHFCKQSSASVFVSVFSSLLTQKRVHERKRRWWCSPS